MKNLFLAVLVAAFLSACLLDGDDGRRRGDLGYVNLTVQLDRNINTLMKSSWTDSTFELDSIKVVLTAPGAVTQIYSYPIQGRPDTGVILAGTGVYALDPLRTWKAKVFTIDTTLNPSGSDTVHMDSVSFGVTLGDTVPVNLLVKSAFAILRVRLVSTSADSLGAGIQYLRIRVNGVTRDSLWVIGHEAHNAVLFPSLTTGWIAADEGKIWKSTDSGNTWYSQPTGTSNNLYALWFSNTTLGWAVGAGGTILRTKNGTTWSAMPSGTTAKLNRVMFVTPAKGYTVGDGGTILKTVDSGSTWTKVNGGWFSQTSPNSANLNSAFFTSPTAGWAAGASGNILRTTNSGTDWTAQQFGNKNWRDLHLIGTTGYAVGDSGKILKTTDGAAWSSQTSPTTEDQYGVDMSSATVAWSVGSDETILKTSDGTNWSHQTGGWFSAKTGITGHINSVNMGTGAVGWAVGDGGFITKSTDGGVSWTPQSSPTVEDLNTVFVWNQNSATAVGQNGKLIKTNYNGTAWVNRTSNTNNHLRDLDMDTVTRGWAVGDNETISQTTDSINWVTKPGMWTEESTGVADTLNAVRFFNGYHGWAVGNGGRALRTTNGGDSWVTYPTGYTNSLRAVHLTSATTAVLIGDAARILRTTNSGSSWSTITIPTSKTQRSLFLHSATVGFMVGDSGTIRRTADGGVNWSGQAISPAASWALLRGTHSNGSYVWTVGDSGRIYYRAAVTAGTHTRATNARRITLNGVYAMTSAVVVAVGQDGTILRTTNGTTSGGTWGRIDSGLTNKHLRSVWFKGTSGTADTGYIVGDSGVLLESTNSGASWALRTSGTPRNLNAVYARPGSADSAIFAGSNGHIARTINGGISWTGQATLKHFNGVDFVSATTGWVVTSDGRVLKTSNGGTRWVLQDNNASTPLNGVYFRNSTIGWVVGNGGVIRKTTDGGSSWNPQGSGFGSYNLTRVHFRATSDTGWITGEAGVLLRTTNGGTLWTKEVVSTGQALRGVFVRTRDSVLVAGDSGNIFKTNNSGVSFRKKATRVDLKGVYFVPSTSTAFAVGTQGTILKTTNSGTTWDSLPSGLATTLNAVMFPTDVTTGYAVGAAGKILKTTNGGTSWSPSTVGSDEFTRVHFANANLGWAVAKTGKIYRTVNAGGAWTAQASGTTQDLAGLFAVNGDSAFAVGASGTILKTRDSGLEITTANLNSTYFRGDTGYVVGAGGATFRTGNAGATWTSLTGTTANLNDVFISPSGNNLYGVGDGGTYITTSNATAPTTWTNIRNSGTTRNLQGVWVSGTSPGPSRILVVGDSGTVRGNAPGVFGDLVNDHGGSTTVNLRSIQCLGVTNSCWAAGGNETVLRAVGDSGNVWQVKSTGPKFFDLNLVYKYIKPAVSNTVILQAIDRSSPLRGFQATYMFTLGAGQDTTLTSTLTRCGYGGPTCTP